MTRTSTITGAVVGNTYTFESYVMTDWGNNCSLVSYPTGFSVAVAADATTAAPTVATTGPWYATSSSIATPPGLSGAPTVIAPPADTTATCGQNSQKFSPDTRITFSVTASATTVAIQYTYWVQSRTCGNYNGSFKTCTGSSTTANDDLGATDPTFVSCTP